MAGRIDTLRHTAGIKPRSRGRPVKLKRHLTSLAAAFRNKGTETGLPQSISGLWRADLFLGSADTDYWVGTTVRSTRMPCREIAGSASASCQRLRGSRIALSRTTAGTL
jgi:hypothetical protein